MRVLALTCVYPLATSWKMQLLHQQPGFIGTVERIGKQRQPLPIELFFGKAKGLYRKLAELRSTPQGECSWKHNPSGLIMPLSLKRRTDQEVISKRGLR